MDAKPRAQTSLELLYNISQELTSELDLHALLQRILLLSLEAVNGISGSIIVLDAQGKPVEAAMAFGDQVYEHTTDQLRTTLENGLAGWVVKNKKAVLIPDTSKDKRWLRLADDSEKRRGAKSAVSSPLISQERLVGVITLVHSKPNTFSEEHLALANSLSDLAAVAVTNARLFEESEHKATVMTTLAESAMAINASLRLEEVIQHILERTATALRVEAVSLALVDSETNKLVFQAATGAGAQNVLGLQLDVGQGIAGWVAKEGRPLIVPEVQEDPRFFSEFDRKTGFVSRAIACAPIITQGKVTGILQAINPISGAFDSHAILLLSGIASLAGSGIQHAQLFELVQSTRKRYQDLFEDSIDSILITDWEGHILEANRQGTIITGTDIRTLQQMQIHQIIELDQEKLGTQFEHLLNDRTISYETELRPSQGHTIPVEVYVRRVIVEGAEQLQWILRDISVRKELDTLRQELISMVYHDMRSPLTNVISSLDVLGSMTEIKSDPSLESVLKIAIRATERIQRLTNSLLDMSRLEAKQPVANQQPVAPLALISETIEAVLPLAENKHQDVRLTASKSLPLVYIDLDMMRRVIINLLENAIKFTPTHGKIFIGAEADKQYVTFWVQDTGPGVPLEEQESIFDKYSRSRDAKACKIKGLGLGLAFCRLAVEGHGGRIWVESKVGVGSRFLFTVPIANPDQILVYESEEAKRAEESKRAFPFKETIEPPQELGPFVLEDTKPSKKDTVSPFSTDSPLATSSETPKPFITDDS
ncbi:MAG: GAF domain-containing protein [Chloroflexota bacterium]